MINNINALLSSDLNFYVYLKYSIDNVNNVVYIGPSAKGLIYTSRGGV